MALTTFFPRWLLSETELEPRAQAKFQQSEKHYFEYGNLGFRAVKTPNELQNAIVGMLICNDRRWQEAWRDFGMQGVEIVCVGYNSAAHDPNGRIVAEAASLEDEIIVADCDFDMCRQGKEKIFNFVTHRRSEAYRLIVDQVGVVEPDHKGSDLATAKAFA